MDKNERKFADVKYSKLTKLVNKIHIMDFPLREIKVMVPMTVAIITEV